MKDLWNETEAAQYRGDLGLRVCTSRLLGRNPALVLHAAATPRSKSRKRIFSARKKRCWHVKGSGWDLETIEAAGFSPVRLDRLLKLARLKSLSDPQMVNELRTHMTRASRSYSFRRSDIARLSAVQVRRPYPRRRRHYCHQHRWWTQTHQGDLRRLGGHRSYVMPSSTLARLCCRALRGRCRAADARHGADEPRYFSFGETAKSPMTHD